MSTPDEKQISQQFEVECKILADEVHVFDRNLDKWVWKREFDTVLVGKFVIAVTVTQHGANRLSLDSVATFRTEDETFSAQIFMDGATFRDSRYPVYTADFDCVQFVLQECRYGWERKLSHTWSLCKRLHELVGTITKKFPETQLKKNPASVSLKLPNKSIVNIDTESERVTVRYLNASGANSSAKLYMTAYNLTEDVLEVVQQSTPNALEEKVEPCTEFTPRVLDSEFNFVTKLDRIESVRGAVLKGRRYRLLDSMADPAANALEIRAGQSTILVVLHEGKLGYLDVAGKKVLNRGLKLSECDRFRLEAAISGHSQLVFSNK